VDLLVNNAALFDMRGLLEMPTEAWRRQLSAMLDGAFLFTRAVARRLVSLGRPGAIVNIVSTAGHQGQPGNIGYCTAKAGLLNFTRSAAMELARYRIRVNSLTPTATDPAESLERATRWGVPPTGHPPELFESFRRRIPGQRLPRPRDYARAVVFLLSADAECITGTDLRVDAGALARYWAWEPGDS
jgi:NAD(P)-dependent dehydrogenase (short-subunit alcohol dehydrogenase family)